MADSNDEKDIQNLIRQYSEQQASFMGNNPVGNNTAQGIDSHQGIDNQGIANDPTPISPAMMGPTKGPSPVPTGNVCPQCNMVHPPLGHGERCPNAVVKSMTQENTDVVVDVNKYLVSLQNILMANIDKRKIKDVNKLFQNITLEITKFLEEYKE